MNFNVLDVITVSCAVHRIQGGFYKKDDVASYRFSTGNKIKANSDILYSHFFDNKTVEVTDEDRTNAAEVIEYLKGLGFKALERQLTDFEKKVLKLVIDTEIGKDRLGIAASLPNVYYNKLESDTWTYRECELGRTSEFLGTEGKTETFDVKIEFFKYIPATASHLVTASVDDKHILKFFVNLRTGFNSNANGLPDWVQKGKSCTIKGTVKPHAISQYSRFKETVINRVKVVSVNE